MEALMKVERRIQIDMPGLGQQIRQARKADARPLTRLAADAGMTTANWYAIENEEIKTLPEDTLRSIEAVLEKDFGVKFDD